MDWTTVVAIILGSSLLSTVFQVIIESRRKRRERGSHDRYLALILADALEAYVHKCNNALDDHQMHIESNGMGGRLMDSVPQTPKISDNDYKTFNVDLLDLVLEFPHRVELGKSYVDFIADVGDHGEVLSAIYESTVELATRALSVADQLRAEYRLSVRKLTYGTYDLRRSLHDRQKELDNKKKETTGLSLS